MAYRLEQWPGEEVIFEELAGDDTISQNEVSAETVQPVLPLEVVLSSLRRLTPQDLALVLKHKLVPAAWLPHRTYYATASRHAKDDASALDLTTVGRVDAQDYRKAVRHVLGDRLLQATTLRLHRQSPALSNRAGPSPVQKMLLLSSLFAVLSAPLVLPGHVASLVTGIPAALIFMAIISLRILCLLPQRTVRQQHRALADDQLPVYSVLVPLFRETSVLPQLLLALRGLAYPRHLLDIKLILEESDTAMQRAVASHVLEEFFDVIIVPAGHPQTKPRALNYALAFARGELVTIYDAEDLPEPQQLRKAAACFAASPPELACVQAELAFFNGADGWLARQFAIEYASLFCVILPCLAQDRLPLPLGGTSNHFRRSVLEAMGAWDPFNVTEDADLGIRMARAGYRTGVIASRTLEEANVSLLSWIKQRSRWLKGFLLTWLVHMRQPVLTMRELGFGGFWVMTAMTLGVFLSALLHPLFLLKIGFDVLTARPPDDGNILVTGFSGLALALFLCGYVCAYLIGRRGIGQRSRTWSFALLTMPIYWLLFMPAAWLALYEALFRPFHWHKTQHGVVVAKQTAKSVIAP